MANRFVLLGFLFLGSVLALPEVPLVTVALTGGPETKLITLGSNFELTCTFNATYPKTGSWKPQLTFYKDGVQLGRFECKLCILLLGPRTKSMHSLGLIL